MARVAARLYIASQLVAVLGFHENKQTRCTINGCLDVAYLIVMAKTLVWFSSLSAHPHLYLWVHHGCRNGFEIL